MLLTAATELGPGAWVNVALSATVGMSGILLLVYVSAIMFVMRHFAGPLEQPLHRCRPAVHVHSAGRARPVAAGHCQLAGHGGGGGNAVGNWRLLHVADHAGAASRRFPRSGPWALA